MVGFVLKQWVTTKSQEVNQSFMSSKIKVNIKILLIKKAYSSVDKYIKDLKCK